MLCITTAASLQSLQSSSTEGRCVLGRSSSLLHRSVSSQRRLPALLICSNHLARHWQGKPTVHYKGDPRGSYTSAVYVTFQQPTVTHLERFTCFSNEFVISPDVTRTHLACAESPRVLCATLGAPHPLSRRSLPQKQGGRAGAFGGRCPSGRSPARRPMDRRPSGTRPLGGDDARLLNRRALYFLHGGFRYMPSLPTVLGISYATLCGQLPQQ